MVKEEEEAVVISNVKKDTTTTNINTCCDSDNKRIGDDNSDLNQISQVWGTWDELVLSCALKRHGFTDWDSIAKEVCSQCSFHASAGDCKLKYQDLKRRFQDSIDGGNKERNSEAAEEEDSEIPWMEELRSLRIAELRREVQRSDDSIVSLQLKVKKLEEENDGNDGDKKPDLEDDDAKPGNNETEPVRLNRETTESDRSMNESNSTIADNEQLGGDKIVRPCENSSNLDLDPVYKLAAKEEEVTVSDRSEMNHSGALDESGMFTGRGKRNGRRYKSGDDSTNRDRSGGDIKSSCDKSQPLKEIIELIRSHPGGSCFESPARSQETKDYKRLIRQHLDIKTIEKKLKKGSYVSSSLLFYRDLKLLFTNAIVFFPPSSSESIAAHELRTLVSEEIKKETAGKSSHSVIKPEAESSVSREKSSISPTLDVGKKKNSSSSLKQKEEKKSQQVSEEKTVSAKSSKRTRKGIAVVVKDTKTGRVKNDIKKQTDTSNSSEDDDKKEIRKKKKESYKKSKKKSAVDFLERIKKNSPEKVKETKTSKDQKKSDGKEKARELRSNSNRCSSKPKQQKKEAETMGKRSKESEKDNKQPKKRSRR